MVAILASVLVALQGAANAQQQLMTFYVQGMSCESCVASVQTALGKVPTISRIDLKLKPPMARFSVDPNKVSLQDVVRAIRSAGKNFDGKLVIEERVGLSDQALDTLDRAISAVPGVKNSGAPNEKGRRMITLDLAKKTSFADLLQAGRSAGVELRTPNGDAPG